MFISPKQLLKIFLERPGAEWRLKDIYRYFNVDTEQKRQIKLMLKDLVRLDRLRLRKGKWYRLGGSKSLPEQTERKKAHIRGNEYRAAIFEKIFEQFELPLVFPDAAYDEAEQTAKWAITLDDEREDFRDIPLVTIDPTDAKDFDDAVCVLPLEDGAFRLYVAIADVSHYVRRGSALDREAYKRSTSVYYPGGVIPMLPEALSNNACSLKPNEDRYAFVAVIDYAQGGRFLYSRFSKGIIRSRQRLTYEEAQMILEGDKTIAAEEKIAQSFQRMQALSKRLIANRKRRGVIELEIPEAWIQFSENLEIIAIRKYPRFLAHRMIEEFMIAANQAVARFLSLKKLPCVYRVHEKPDAEKMENFAALAHSLGLAFPINEPITPKRLSVFLESLKTSDEKAFLHFQLLRSMKQADYRSKNEGHFGLALKYYCHFTSPIRRYPDLIVHRLLAKALEGFGDNRAITKEKKRLPDQATHLSNNERRAISVERKARAVCQAEYMQYRLDEEFYGIISGVAKFGFFVQINSPFVEGLVSVSSLKDDYYIFDEDAYALIGRTSGRAFRMGDKVKVRSYRVNVALGQVDFRLLEASANQPKRDLKRHLIEPTKRTSRKKRRPTKQKPTKRSPKRSKKKRK